MASKLLLIALTALVVLAIIKTSSGIQIDCRCKLMRTCNNDPIATHYDFLPGKNTLRVAGKRNRRNPNRFCKDECLDKLHGFLGRSDAVHATVGLPVVEIAMDDIAFHRICQPMSVTRTKCTFTLEWKGRTKDQRVIGNSGCLVLQLGTAPDTVLFKMALDYDSVMTAYGGSILDYTMITATGMISDVA